MIRINLLAGSRKNSRRGVLDLARWGTLSGVVIVCLSLVFMIWRTWSLRDVSTRLGRQVAAADQELAQLGPALERVAVLAQREGQLTARIGLIQRLREEQVGAVRILDHVSRSLPDGLWLSELRQRDDAVVVRGQAMTHGALSAFAANLEGAGGVEPPVQIIDSQTDDTPLGEVVTFELRAVFDGNVQ